MKKYYVINYFLILLMMALAEDDDCVTNSTEVNNKFKLEYLNLNEVSRYIINSKIRFLLLNHLAYFISIGIYISKFFNSVFK